MEKLQDILFKFLRLDGLFNHLSGYVEARVELIKMEIREEVARVLASALIFVVVFFFGCLFTVFFSIGLAHFLNRYFYGSYTGYWAVAGFYLVGFFIFLIFRKNILRGFGRYLSGAIKRR